MMWGIFVRLVAVYHVTWLVNSACHFWGYRNFDINNDRSKNNWIVGVLAMGEGWHNNHHAIADSARHGLKWWEFDSSWQLIKLGHRLGWIDDIKEGKLPQPSDDFQPSFEQMG